MLIIYSLITLTFSTSYQLSIPNRCYNEIQTNEGNNQRKLKNKTPNKNIVKLILDVQPIKQKRIGNTPRSNSIK